MTLRLRMAAQPVHAALEGAHTMAGQRRTVHFRFALGARVVWLGTAYVVDRRRWEERRLFGPVVQYALVDVHVPGTMVVWAEEADLQEDERRQA